MSRLKAWHANVLGAVVVLALGVTQARLGPAATESLIFSVALLGVGIVGTVASIPSTVLFLAGRLRRIAVLLNVVVAAALAVVFFPIGLAFGAFLLVGALLGWREAGQ